MILAYFYISHDGHDGKPGLPSEDIIEDTYHGNRCGTKLGAPIRGTVADAHPEKTRCDQDIF